MNSKSSKQSEKRSERGAIHVLVALLVIPLIGCMALAVDGFLLITSNLQQNNNAEYAALAALKEMRAREAAGLALSDRIEPAVERAEAVAGNHLNRYVGRHDKDAVANTELKSGAAGTVRFGKYDPATHTFTVGVSTARVDSTGAVSPIFNAVQVQLKTQNGDNSRNTTIHTVFAGILGARELGMKSIAYACYDPARDTPGSSAFSLCKPTVVNAQCDTSGDGIADVDDIIKIIQLLRRQRGLGDYTLYEKPLDIDNNNKIDINDALTCIQYFRRNRIPAPESLN